MEWVRKKGWAGGHTEGRKNGWKRGGGKDRVIKERKGKEEWMGKWVASYSAQKEGRKEGRSRVERKEGRKV